MEYTFTYEYLVAYVSYTEDNEQYFGRDFLVLKNPITRIQHLEEIEEIIFKAHGGEVESILITNYQLIGVIKTKKQKRRKRKNDNTTDD